MVLHAAVCFILCNRFFGLKVLLATGYGANAATIQARHTHVDLPCLRSMCVLIRISCFRFQERVCEPDDFGGDFLLDLDVFPFDRLFLLCWALC